MTSIIFTAEKFQIAAGLSGYLPNIRPVSASWTLAS